MYSGLSYNLKFKILLYFRFHSIFKVLGYNVVAKYISLICIPKSWRFKIPGGEGYWPRIHSVTFFATMVILYYL